MLAMTGGFSLGLGGLSLTAITGGGGGVKTLPFDPVLLMLPGDSNGRGSAATADQNAFIAAYQADSKVKALSTSGGSNGSFANDYAPGTLTGLNALVNTGNVGAEAGFIARFRAAYPNNTLYVAKVASVGSYITRGVSTGTLTGSISGNVLTVTSGTVVLNSLIVGTGVPAGTYISSLKSGNDYFIAKAGQATAVNYTVASTTLTTYAYTLSWSSTEGGLWNGIGGQITNGYRAKLLTALASLANPRIVAVGSVIGSNDAANAGTAAFQSDMTAFLARLRSDITIPSGTPIIQARQGSGTQQATISAAQDAIALSDADFELVATDDLTRIDGTHFDIASLLTIGDRMFDVAAPWLASLAA
jgi:hypothetical protein